MYTCLFASSRGKHFIDIHIYWCALNNFCCNDKWIPLTFFDQSNFSNFRDISEKNSCTYELVKFCFLHYKNTYRYIVFCFLFFIPQEEDKEEMKEILEMKRVHDRMVKKRLHRQPGRGAAKIPSSK